MKRDPYAWMVTFSDMNTLMMTFFVLLVSMSSFDTQTFRNYSKAVKEALISIKGGEGVFKGRGRLVAVSNRREALIKAKLGIPGQIISELTKHLDVIQTKEGWTIRIPGDIIFERNSYNIKPEAIEYLKKISKLIWKVRGEVRIIGYTDNSENDKWYLSIKRASRVLDFFLKNRNIEPSRFTIIGYADTKPLFPNSNETNRSKNRRIEIYIENRGSNG